uniref:Uncharacterized protein n=2 Tax=Noctiluca scintillans TaxID=2966 RepID=A0A7S1EV35_NOCSC
MHQMAVKESRVLPRAIETDLGEVDAQTLTPATCRHAVQAEHTPNDTIGVCCDASIPLTSPMTAAAQQASPLSPATSRAPRRRNIIGRALRQFSAHNDLATPASPSSLGAATQSAPVAVCRSPSLVEAHSTSRLVNKLPQNSVLLWHEEVAASRESRQSMSHSSRWTKDPYSLISRSRLWSKAGREEVSDTSPRAVCRPSAPTSPSPHSEGSSPKVSRRRFGRSVAKAGKQPSEEFAVFRLDVDDSGAEAAKETPIRTSSITRDYKALGSELYSLEDAHGNISMVPSSNSWKEPWTVAPMFPASPRHSSEKPRKHRVFRTEERGDSRPRLTAAELDLGTTNPSRHGRDLSSDAVLRARDFHAGPRGVVPELDFVSSKASGAGARRSKAVGFLPLLPANGKPADQGWGMQSVTAPRSARRMVF